MKPILRHALSIIVVFLAPTAFTQEQGRWSAHFLPDRSVNLSLQSGENERQGFSNRSLTLPLARLQKMNFPPGSATTSAHFELKADAGTVAFNGVASGDSGAGKYAFTPDEQFRPRMQRLGFVVEPEQQLTFALQDVTLDYAKAMHDATGVTEAGRLLKMARLGVDVAFVKKLSKAAGEKLEAEEIVEAAKHGVTPEYVSTVHKMLPRAEFDDISQLQRREVSIEFIAAAQKCRSDISADEIARLKRKYGNPCLTRE